MEKRIGNFICPMNRETKYTCGYCLEGPDREWWCRAPVTPPNEIGSCTIEEGACKGDPVHVSLTMLETD